jgi:monovalent cation/hydrogen antiporter
VGSDDEGAAGDGRRVLARLSEVALDHLDALDAEADGVPAELVERLRERYRSRLAHLDAQRADSPPDGTRAYAELVSDLLEAQRAELRRLREEGRVTPEVARRLFHDLDLEESRLERRRPS